MRRSEYGILVALAAMWGLSYVFYRVGAPALGPALFVELRVALAAALMVPYLLWTGHFAAIRRRLRDGWQRYAILGALNNAIPYTLIAYGELSLPASYAAVLNATAPLFGVLLSAVWFGVPITFKRAGGVGLGIAGVAVLVGAAPFGLSPGIVVAIVVTIVAALSYAVAAGYVKARFAGETPTVISFGQLAAATLLLVPFGAVGVPSAHFTTIALLSVVGMATVSTVVALILYFRILQSAGPTSALTVTFLMPIFGVIWGHLLLGETIGIGVIAGTAIILLAVGLVTDLRLRGPATESAPTIATSPSDRQEA